MIPEILKLLNEPAAVGIVVVLGFYYLNMRISKIVTRFDKHLDKCEKRFIWCTENKLFTLKEGGKK